MEGNPRSQEQPEDTDDDSKESGKSKKRQRNLSLGLRGAVERPKSADQSEEDRNSRAWWPSFERINQRRDAKIIMPDLEPISAPEVKKPKIDTEDEDYEEDKDTLQAVVPEEGDATNEAALDTYGAWSPPVAETPSEDDTNPSYEATPYRSFTDYVSLRPLNIETSESTPTDTADRPNTAPAGYEEPELMPDAIEEGPSSDPEVSPEAAELEESELETVPLATEPESIESILRRRSRVHEYSPPTDTDGAAPSETVIQNNVSNIETNNYYENRNSGLHLLNYALARRRDARDRRVNQKEFKRIDAKIEELSKQPRLETQRKEVITDTKTHTVFERNKQETPKAVVQEATIETEKTIHSREQDASTKINDSPERRDDRTNQTAEQILQQVIESGEKKDGIQSEAVFESRHEIKDAPMPAFTQYGVAEDTAAPRPQYIPPTPAQPNYTMPSQIRDGDQRQKIDDRSEYSEVITTGAWGVAVGIIVFVIFYMLTKS